VPDETSTKTDEEQILQLHLDWVQANRTGDTAWCRANMRSGPDGIRLFNTNGSEYVGVEHWCSLWDIYRTRIKGDRVKKEPPLFESVDPHIEICGDIAWVTSWFRAKADVQGKPLPELSRATEIWMRTDDGWKMVHGHWSFGGPGAPANGGGPELKYQEWTPLH
jgi:ketosteroid isomerase-like protein